MSISNSSPTPVFMFPGQTSRDPEMINRVQKIWPGAKAIVDAACAALDRDIPGVLTSAIPFNCNRDIQVAVFLTSYLHCAALESQGISTQFSLGLSLGEYNHLVHIGAIDFLDALKLVDERGCFYDESPPGKMIAVMPLNTSEILEFLEKFEYEGTLEIANYNSPTQHIIAGEPQLVSRFADYLEEEAMAMCLPVDDRLAMHTHIMDEVAEKFLPTLENAGWTKPMATYRPGVDPSLLITAPDEIPCLLQRHVNRPVYFYRTLEYLLNEASQPILIEVGPENTIANIMRRCRKEKILTVDDPAQGCINKIVL